MFSIEKSIPRLQCVLDEGSLLSFELVPEHVWGVNLDWRMTHYLIQLPCWSLGRDGSYVEMICRFEFVSAWVTYLSVSEVKKQLELGVCTAGR